MKKMGLRAGLVLLATAMVSSAAPILSENFEGGVTDGFVSTTGAIPNTIFSLVGGTVDLIGPTYFSGLCTAPASTNCLDTQGGGSGPLGEIRTTNATSFAAGTYSLSFVLTGWSFTGDNETASVQVTLGSLVNQTIFVNGALNPYAVTTIGFVVPSTTSASLDFKTLSTSVTYAGGILDNIQINAVPEPASVMLVGLGLGCLGLISRRRRTA